MASLPDQHEDNTGDPHENFLRLWSLHEPGLRAYIQSCCPRAQEVDEVLQDVSIAAWRKFPDLDEHEAFGRWAGMIARYELLKARRRFARDRLVLSENIVKLLADEGAAEISHRHRQLEALDGCIEKLSPERSELVLTAYSNNISIRDLAGKLKRSENSLYQLLYRIRQELHNCMEKSLNRKSSS